MWEEESLHESPALILAHNNVMSRGKKLGWVSLCNEGKKKKNDEKREFTREPSLKLSVWIMPREVKKSKLVSNKGEWEFVFL